MSKKSNTFNSVTRKYSLRLPLEIDAVLEVMMCEKGMTKSALVIRAIKSMIAVDNKAANRA